MSIDELICRGRQEAFKWLERTGAPHLLKPFDLWKMRQLVNRLLAELESAGRSTTAPGQ